MTVTEKTILTLLKKGYSQKEIAEHFKQDDSLRISGLSSIEKTIKSLKNKTM
jgi:DNA-binding NarL/FixJ family response regulator